MPSFSYPSVDESFARLHHAGWSIGDIATAHRWIVSGTNGENKIYAEGESQAEAWYRATLQAEAVGMLAANQELGRGSAPRQALSSFRLSPNMVANTKFGGATCSLLRPDLAEWNASQRESRKYVISSLPSDPKTNWHAARYLLEKVGFFDYFFFICQAFWRQ
jgi:hypothetical protein